MYRLKLLLFCLLVAINAAPPSTVLAETYYVDGDDGNDSYTGFAKTYDGVDGPWQHIHRAFPYSPWDSLNRPTGGDTVKVVARAGGAMYGAPGGADTYVVRYDSGSWNSGRTDYIIYEAYDPTNKPRMKHLELENDNEMYMHWKNFHIINDEGSFSIEIAGDAEPYKINNVILENIDVETTQSVPAVNIYNVNNVELINCTTIGGHDAVIEFSHVVNGTLTGCDINQPSTDCISISKSDNIIIQDSDMHGPTSTEHTDAIHMFRTDNTIIRRNRFWDHDKGTIIYSTVDGFGGQCTNITIENNIMWGRTIAGQIKLEETDGIIIRNNTFACHYQDDTGSSIIGDHGGNGNYCTNIEMYGNLWNHKLTVSSECTLKDNDPNSFKYNIFNNLIARPAIGISDDNIELDELGQTFEDISFVTYADADAAADVYTGTTYPNLHLASDSMAIDFGDSTSAPATDILGNTRDANPDAGCYEYVSSDPNNPAPNADAGQDQTVTDSGGNGKEKVTLDGSGSTDSDGTIVSWVWTDNLGDTITDGVTTKPTLSVGTHTITLTVTDDDSLTDTDMVIITIGGSANQAPVLEEIGDKSVNENTLLTFTVTAADADGDTITYSAQNLPNGATFASPFSWTPGYDQAGTYDVTFIASDGQAENSETITITVNNNNQAPNADAGPDQTVADSGGNGKEKVTLDGSGSTDSDGTIVSWVWTDNLGDTITDGVTTKPTLSVGTHTITLTVTDDDSLTDTDMVKVTINGSSNQAPTANAGSDQAITDSDGNGSQRVTLDGSGSTDSDGTIQSYVWSKGSTQIATGVSPQLTLSTGQHTIKLTVTDDDSLTDTDMVKVTINESPKQAPNADAGQDQTVTDSDGNGSQRVTLDGSGSTDSDGTIQSYVWSKGSTQIATGVSPKVMFSTGQHTITLTVTDDDSLTDTDMVTITVNEVDVIAPVVTNFSPAADSIQVPLNNLIILHIVDAGEGVDANSPTIYVNDNIVYTGNTPHYSSEYGHCRRRGTKSDYTFIYQSNDMFDFDKTMSVTVNATDLAGNPMDEYSYPFRTETRSFGKNKKANSGSDNLSKGKPVTVRDTNGDIWVAWHAGPIGSRNIYVSKLTAGAEYFGSSVQLTDNAADQCNPAIALDSHNKIYVVWQDNQRENWDIYISTSVNGRNWSNERRVTDSNDNQVNPAIVIDGLSPNRGHIVWQDDRGGNQDIYIATSKNGFVTKTVSRITTDGSDQVELAIAADSDNTIYVVWTDARSGSNDIYGAASNNGPWTNVAIVSNANIQSSPAIATEAVGSILHLLWVDRTSGEQDIYYAASDGLPSSPLTGSSIIDDSSANPSNPVIAVTGSTGNDLGVFACWQDERNADTDLYLTELSSSSGTNVLVGDDSTNADQSEPAMAIDVDGHPHIVWADSRNTNTDIYFAGSTFIESDALTSKDVSASSGATVGTEPSTINGVDDVSVVVPPGAYSSDVKVTISRIKNPQKITLDRFSSPYEFGPSGINFSEPVTITIPYNVSGSGDSVSVYWYNALTGTTSQQGITNVEKVIISPTLHALRFKTTHFTEFFVGGLIAGLGGGLGGGLGSGGCSMSPNSQGHIMEFLLPYIGLTVVMVILKLRDVGKRKARNITKSER